MLLLSGCSTLQPEKTSSVNLEKLIERQEESYKLRDEPRQKEKLTKEEYESRGDQHLRSNDINRAYINYVKGLAEAPRDVPLLHKTAALLLKKRKYAEAEKTYRSILAITAKDATAQQGLGRALFGQEKNLEEAESAFRTALAINPKLWQSHLFLGLVHNARKQYDQAVQEFRLALKQEPKDVESLNNLAITYSLMEQYEQAESILADLARTTNEKKVHNNLAVVYFRLGKYDKALAAFKKGAANEAVAQYNMGVEYMAIGMHREAVASFEEAMFLHPKYYSAAAANLERAQKALK